MKIKRFTAANMQAGLKSISETLGPEAVILSNRRVHDGLEIVAGVDEQEFERFQATQQSMEAESDIIKVDPTNPESLDKETMQQLFSAMSDKNKKAFDRPQSAEFVSESSQPFQPEPVHRAKPQRAKVQEHQQEGVSESTPPRTLNDGAIAMLRQEIDGLKDLLREQTEQLKEPMTHPTITPHYERLESRLFTLGFTGSLSRKMMAHFDREESVEQNWRKMMGRLASAIPAPMYEPLADGGVFALTGPTGAGKTTTIAKLAAHAVKDHGSHSVAVISLDWFQVGGQEILRSVSEILGIEFRALTEKDNLLEAVKRLKSKRLVLIDTSGSAEAMAHWNAVMAEENLSSKIHTLLVMPATMQPSAINQFISAHQGNPFSGVIVSKLDESACFGGILEPILKHRWPLWYCTTGQNIPQDIEFADSRKLVKRLMAGLQSEKTVLATAS
jgi:flagellar biosynthesis protein FlhF